jgi:hypothetical protein
MRFVTLWTLAALFAAGCGGGEQPAVGVADRVFKLEIDLDRLAQPACGDPSCVLVEHLEWVAPERGWWRRETEDGSGYRTTTVFAHGRYANIDEVRIGSPGFIGFLGRPPPSLTRLRNAKRSRAGTRSSSRAAKRGARSASRRRSPSLKPRSVESSRFP